MKQSFTCIGSAGRDIFFPLEEARVLNTPEDLTSQRNIVLELGAKYRTESRYEAPGGCAANVSLALARLGIPVSIQCVVGGDSYGREILAELEAEGVKTKQVVRDTSSGTDVSCILVESKSADRVIVYNRDANEHLSIREESIAHGSDLFVGGMYGEWKKNISVLEKLAREQRARLFYNPGQQNIEKGVARVLRAIAVSEIVFLNKDEAMEVALRGLNEVNTHRVTNEKYLVKKIFETGVRYVVMTDGSRGAWAYDGKECYHAKTSRIFHVVDSTGAGDACTGAFLAGFARGKGVAECLRWGVVNGASAVQHYGAKEGLLTLSEIQTRARRVKVTVV